MSYGERIRQWRVARGWSQLDLSQKLGCTDSYITHMENQGRIPSLDICLALAELFALTPQEQQAFIDEVEAMRRQRTETRLRTRSAVVHGAIRTRGIATRSSAPSAGDTASYSKAGAMDPQTIAHDLAAYPELATAYHNLKTVLTHAHPEMRSTVLAALDAWARTAHAEPHAGGA